jgi:hypothetical protein
LLTGLLVFTGCFNALTAPETAAPGETGTVEILIGGAGSARTLAPSVSAFEKIELVFRSYSGSNSNDKVTLSGAAITTSTSVELDPGTWSVTATAYAEGKPSILGTYLATGTYSPYALTTAVSPSTFNVVAGETVQIPIVLFYGANQDLRGTLDYSVTLPTVDGTTYTPTITLAASASNSMDTISGNNSPTNLLLDVGRSGEVDLPAGRYTLTIGVTTGRSVTVAAGCAGLVGEAGSETLRVYRREEVYIYPGLKTPAHFTFTEADFKAYEYFYGTIHLYDFSNSDDYDVTRVEFESPTGAAWQTTVAKITSTVGADAAYTWELIVPSEDLAANLTNDTPLEYVVTFTSASDPTKVLTSPTRTTYIDRIQGNFNVLYYPRIYTITPAPGLVRKGEPVRTYQPAPINANRISSFADGPGHWDEVAGNRVYFQALVDQVPGKGFASNRRVQILNNDGYRTAGGIYSAAEFIPTPPTELLRHYYVDLTSATFSSSNSDLEPVAEGPFYEFTGSLGVSTPNGYDRATVTVYKASGDPIGTSAEFTIPTTGANVGTSQPWTVAVSNAHQNSTEAVYYEVKYRSTGYPATNPGNIPVVQLFTPSVVYGDYSGGYVGQGYGTAYDPTWNFSRSGLTVNAPVPSLLSAGLANYSLALGGKNYYYFDVAPGASSTLRVLDNGTTPQYAAGGFVKVSVWVDGSPIVEGAVPNGNGYEIDNTAVGAVTNKRVYILVEQRNPNAVLTQGYQISR